MPFCCRKTGRSRKLHRPMAALAAKGAPGSQREISFTREGTGTLFYVARLNYAADRLYQQGLDSGFRIERRYVTAF